jgi:PPOX class probable F420-dependent enzyme
VSSRVITTDSTSRQAAAGSYLAWLAPAKYLLLTTFRRDGTPVSAPVRVVADGDRLYFRAPGSSGTSKRIQRTDWVQVARCTVLPNLRRSADQGIQPEGVTRTADPAAI